MNHAHFLFILWLPFLFSCAKNIKAETETEVISISQTSFSEPDTVQNISTADILPKNEPISADSLARLHQRYNQIRHQILAQRDVFRQEYEQAEPDSLKDSILKKAGIYLNERLAEEIFPAWYGTSWDFNGYTNKPQSGEIACGYFVSTPLKHVGVDFNRYKVAQQYSSAIVDLLCSEKKQFRELEKMLDYVESQPDDLYIVGLSNHVGFIRKSGIDIRFIHSSYYKPVAVVSEWAEESEVLGFSSIYVLGTLTSNPEFVRKWVLSEEIVVGG